MLKAIPGVIGRFRVLGVLLLTMAFVTPMFASHACAATDADPAAMTAALFTQPPADACADCPDCGPACANGCCHAPHPGMASDAVTTRIANRFDPPAAWTHVTWAPMSRPSGPDRPPRP